MQSNSACSCSIHDIDAVQLGISQLGSEIAEKEQISHERNDARQTIPPPRAPLLLIDLKHLESRVCKCIQYYGRFCKIWMSLLGAVCVCVRAFELVKLSNLPLYFSVCFVRVIQAAPSIALLLPL